jgi:putative MATE family efflux protein
MNISATELRLREGEITPLFRKYAIPSVISLLFVGLQTIIDGIIVGNYAGANALASISLILPFYSFIAAMAVVIGIGCQTMISIKLGEKNHQQAHDALKSAFVFVAVFSVLLCSVSYFFVDKITLLLGADDVLFHNAVSYLKILLPFFPLIMLMFFSDFVIKSIGKPIFSMVIMTITVILNIILDLLFVMVLDMGTMGAGLATGLSFTVGICFNLPMILGSKNIVSIQLGHYNWRMVKQMLYNGSSEGATEFSTGITTLLFNLTLMHYLGANGIAAFTAINYVFFIGVIVFLGISDGVIPIVGYNYGANNWTRIKQVLSLALRSNFTIGVFIFLILFFFGENVIALFFTSDEVEVLDIATKGTAIYAFAFLINGLNILASSYFTAIGNAKLSIIISLLRGLIFVGIGIYLLPQFFGIGGIWYAVPIAELLTLTVSVYLVSRSLKNR